MARAGGGGLRRKAVLSEQRDEVSHERGAVALDGSGPTSAHCFSFMLF